MRHKNLILGTVGWVIAFSAGVQVHSKPWLTYVAAVISGLTLGRIAAAADRYDELLSTMKGEAGFPAPGLFTMYVLKLLRYWHQEIFLSKKK